MKFIEAEKLRLRVVKVTHPPMSQSCPGESSTLIILLKLILTFFWKKSFLSCRHILIRWKLKFTLKINEISYSTTLFVNNSFFAFLYARFHF
jgi:hypothetical protein